MIILFSIHNPASYKMYNAYYDFASKLAKTSFL